MVVATVQTALALFPLGLRFVFSHVLNPKENHAFGVYVSVYCTLFGWGMVFLGSGVLCRKNDIREEFTYSFDVAGEVGRRVAFTIIS